MAKKSEFNYTLDMQDNHLENQNYLKLLLRQLTVKGSRHKGEMILFNLCKKLKHEYKNQSVTSLVYTAIENVKPFLEIRNVRVSGMTRQVPSILNQNRQTALAIRWIIEAAKKRNKKTSLTFSDTLCLEILDALKKRGTTKQKTEELHKVAVLNRAFAHYRWW